MNCLPHKYSDVLKLCYDENTGYVWDDSVNDWRTPPTTPACAPYVFWPKINGCYDPESGYGCDPANCQPTWKYFGEDYTLETESDSSSCSLLSAPRSQDGAIWAFLGLAAGGALVVGRRRAKASR
jgi:hypothetical protein